MAGSPWRQSLRFFALGWHESGRWPGRERARASGLAGGEMTHGLHARAARLLARYGRGSSLTWKPISGLGGAGGGSSRERKGKVHRLQSTFHSPLSGGARGENCKLQIANCKSRNERGGWGRRDYGRGVVFGPSPLPLFHRMGEGRTILGARPGRRPRNGRSGRGGNRQWAIADRQ